MKFLLDTHLLLWAASEPSRLSLATIALLEDSESELLFSAASLWEVAIKIARRRADFDLDPRVLRRNLLDHAYEELPIRGDHVVAVSDLPAIHKDPFDRILIAQAVVEGIVLLTTDSAVARYPGPIRSV